MGEPNTICPKAQIGEFRWISNFFNAEARTLEQTLQENRTPYLKLPACTTAGQIIPSMSAIYLPAGVTLERVWAKLNSPERNGYVEKEQYPGPLEKVVVVQTHEWGVTDAKQSKPVIATDAINTCMVVVGFEPTQKRGFLVHLTETSDAPSTLRAIEKEIKVPGKYQLRILGGTSRSQQERADELKRLFQNSIIIQGEFVEIDLFGGDFNAVRSIALDTQTGRVYTFRGLAPTKSESAQWGLLGAPAIKATP